MTNNVEKYELPKSGINWYPGHMAKAKRKLKKEALQNGLAAEESLAQNRFLTAEERENLLPLLELMERGLSYSLSNLPNSLVQMLYYISFCKLYYA